MTIVQNALTNEVKQDARDAVNAYEHVRTNKLCNVSSLFLLTLPTIQYIVVVNCSI